MAELDVIRFVIGGNTYRIPTVTSSGDGLMTAADYEKLKNINADISNEVAQLNDAVFPYSLSVRGGGVFEKGTTQSITVSWTFKKGTTVITADSVKINNSVVTGTSKVFTGVTTNITYNVEATKGGKTKTASTSVRFVNPSYLGVVAANFSPSESNIKTLAKAISESKGRNLTGATLNNQKVCYAYPKSFGILTSIKDANNFDYIGSYNRSEMMINGETYYIYLLKDASSISNFKQVFS